MNFYNPYYYTATSSASTSLLSKINIKSIIAGTSKALGFVNQTIPIIRQVSPVMRNARTMYKLLSEFRRSDEPVQVEETKGMKEVEVIEASEPTIEARENNTPNFFV